MSSVHKSDIFSVMRNKIDSILKESVYHDAVMQVLDLSQPFTTPIVNQYNYTSLINEITMLNKSVDTQIIITPLQEKNTHNDKFIGSAVIHYKSVTIPIGDDHPFPDKTSCSNNICEIMFSIISGTVKSLILPKWYRKDLINGDSSLEEVIQLIEKVSVDDE